MSISQYEQSTSGWVPRQNNVSNERTAIKFWIEDQEPSVIFLAPVHTATRKIIVLVVREDRVEALDRRPYVDVSFVESFEARDFRNATERPRKRGQPRRTAVLRDKPKQTHSWLFGGKNWLDIHAYLYCSGPFEFTELGSLSCEVRWARSLKQLKRASTNTSPRLAAIKANTGEEIGISEHVKDVRS